MPTYKYIAVNLQKKKYKGIFIAEDEKDLAVQLTKQNLYLVSASVYKGGTPSARFPFGAGNARGRDLTTFCRQFSIMLSTGIALPGCIDSLKVQPYSACFRSALQVISEDVKSGAMLSQALEKHSQVFPTFFRSMVRIGEASGNLEAVFLSLADYYETEADTKRKVKNAMSYPALLAVMTLGILILMLTFVIPTFRDALAKMDVPVEGLTKTIYDVSDFFLRYWLGMLILAALLLTGLYLLAKTRTGKRVFDFIKVKFPLIGPIQTDLITARFARAFSLLLSSGMDLASALDTVSIILDNTYFEARFNEAAEDVRRGVSLTHAFGKQNLFPQMLLQMLAVGEESASLEEVFGRSCKFFDAQVEISLNAITAKLQPVMLLLLGAVIAVLFMAVYSPMLSIMNALGGGP